MTSVSPSHLRPRRFLGDFNGDFEKVASLIQNAWADNRQSLFYTSEFLASCFDYPGAKFSLAPTLYEDYKPVGFAAGFPRCLRLEGRELRLVCSSFLSVAPQYKKAGYGIVLWTELVRRARDAAFDGMIEFCVEGEAMNDIVVGACLKAKIPVERINSVHYLSRLIFPRSAGPVCQANSDDIVDAFLELSSSIAGRVPLARIWTWAEAEWQCRSRNGAIAVCYKSGSRKGILTGYMITVANAVRAKCLMIEDILWHDLEPGERQVLLRRLLDAAAAAGAKMATVPILGYVDVEPFHATKFRPSSRILHTYLSVWNGASPPRIQSMYVDVF